jgi:putative DNA primase/helicase
MNTDNTSLALLPANDGAIRPKTLPPRAPRQADEPTPVISCHPPTEAGLAERLADKFACTFRYCDALEGWHRFDGAKWVRGETGLMHACLETARGIPVEAVVAPTDEARTKILKFAITCEKSSTIRGAITIARDLPAFVTEATAFDADPWSLNLKNGTLDLGTGTLRPHNAKELHTQVATVSYDAEATCPRWLAFLEEVQPDPSARAFLQRLLGYMLTGLANERKFFVFYGEGDNGKSVVVNTIVRLLGDYGCTPERDLIIASDNDKHTTRIADLKGKRVAGMSENKQGRKFDEALLKNLTGNEPITARRMRCDNMSFAMSAKLVISVNDRPRIEAGSKAVWNRLVEVPFGVKIPKERIDRSLEEKLFTEAAGILNWCLEGLAQWRVTGLGTCEAVERAGDDYKRENDDVGRFLAEMYQVDAVGRISRKELRAAFNTWTGQNDAHESRSLSDRQFSARVRDCGVKEGKSNGAEFWILKAVEQVEQVEQKPYEL